MLMLESATQTTQIDNDGGMVHQDDAVLLPEVENSNINKRNVHQ